MLEKHKLRLNFNFGMNYATYIFKLKSPEYASHEVKSIKTERGFISGLKETQKSLGTQVK
eukprot:snap_masked-scaffold_5-processed-gene-3.14-mRNA-1 protein AED:1.00 eAED:1.00 QI:0/0/0/0/1/1/2/0/59